MPTELDPHTPITYLPNINRPSVFSSTPLAKALDEIKSDKYKAQIENLRALYLTDKPAYTEQKRGLPAFCFNGTFSGSVKNETFNGSSNLFNADIDGLKGDIEEHKLAIVDSTPSVVYCCVSPSGAGLKVGLRVDAGAIKTDEDCKKIFTAAERAFAAIGFTIDKSCKNVSRACFVSYDPDIFVHYDAAVFAYEQWLPALEIGKPIKGTSISEPQAQTQALTSGLYSIEADCIGIVTGMLNKATNGERHRARLAAGRLAGGYAAGDLVKEQVIWAALIEASDLISNGGVTSVSELQTLRDGFNEGLKYPIYKLESDCGIVEFINAVNGNPTALSKNSKGRIQATLGNIYNVLSTPDFSGFEVGYDSFKDQIMFRRPDQGNNWTALEDETYTKLRIDLPKLGFEEVPAPLMRDAVHYAAKQNKFDSAQEWLSGLIWDGVPRVEAFNPTYFATVDNEYTRAAGLFLWTAATGRILDPGCQCDMVPVYQSPQGDGKSSAVAAIAPKDMSTEISFLDEEDKSSRKLRGVVVAEISELRGLHTKDVESIKAFITRRYDRWVPKYKEFAIEAPRRSIFIGTTNNKEFLGDPTGQRRWLPMSSGKVDKEGIERDRDQLWAEAAVIYKERGICWQDAERLAEGEHEDYIVEDVWSGPVQLYLEEAARLGSNMSLGGMSSLSTAAILFGALGIELKNQRRVEEMRASAVLRALGYQPERKMIAGKRKRIWVRPN